MKQTFEEIGLIEPILKAVQSLGFENPTPVQEAVIPHMLQDTYEDIIALAQTGTGKTAAFGLPIIQHTDTNSNKTQYLILSPTRELCLQIADDLALYAKFIPNLKIAAVFGGSSIERQIQHIKKGVQIISATPGRLYDLIQRNIINLKTVKTVVLDEADEMLTMGFRDTLEAILDETPAKKNTVLFSATMSKEVKNISEKYLTNAKEIILGQKNAGAEKVNHFAYFVNERDRYLALKRIVDFYPEIYGIIFCRTRLETQDIADKLLAEGYDAEALHGDLSQAQRDHVMGKFRSKHLRLLVATDVAARGLDVNDLTHIINYKLPDELEVYTHRSGRTGRAGKAGISIAIANMREKHILKTLEKKLKKNFKIEPVPQGKAICQKQLLHLIDRIEKIEVIDSEINEFLPEIFQKLEWLDREELIKKFVSVEFNRFLAYYRNTEDLKAPKPGDKPDNRRSKKDSNKSFESSGDFTRFFINIGKTDKINPATIIGMVNDFTGKKNIGIGEIDIKQNFSFFEVDAEYEDMMLSAFQKKKLKNRDIALEVANKPSGKSSGKRKDFSSKKRKVIKGKRQPSSKRKRK